MRISDWSSDVCSADLLARRVGLTDRDALDQHAGAILVEQRLHPPMHVGLDVDAAGADRLDEVDIGDRPAHRPFGDLADRPLGVVSLADEQVGIAHPYTPYIDMVVSLSVPVQHDICTPP